MYRCATWGLSGGRSLPGPLNSSVVRVTEHHKVFLDSWRQVLLGEAYVAEHAKPAAHRNQHLPSDQDALSALLASEEFANHPCGPAGTFERYSPAPRRRGLWARAPMARWSNVKQGMPVLIHAMGSVNPWIMPDRP
jgi:hypothetical protein